MLRRALTRPGPWLIAGFLAGAFVLYRWVEASGGPAPLIERFGVVAPAVMVAIQAALSAAPFPSELFALVSSAAYGFWIGTLITTLGWIGGSMIQYALARRGAQDLELAPKLERLPGWLRRVPVTSPWFLVTVRWLPMGFHLANAVAGARRVPPLRQLWVAALGSLPVAAFWAAVGAGISPW